MFFLNSHRKISKESQGYFLIAKAMEPYNSLARQWNTVVFNFSLSAVKEVEERESLSNDFDCRKQNLCAMTGISSTCYWKRDRSYWSGQATGNSVNFPLKKNKEGYSAAWNRMEKARLASNNNFKSLSTSSLIVNCWPLSRFPFERRCVEETTTLK